MGFLRVYKWWESGDLDIINFSCFESVSNVKTCANNASYLDMIVFLTVVIFVFEHLLQLRQLPHLYLTKPPQVLMEQAAAVDQANAAASKREKKTPKKDEQAKDGVGEDSSSTNVPLTEKLTSSVPKTNAYTRDKLVFGWIRDSFNICFALAVTLFGIEPFLWNYCWNLVVIERESWPFFAFILNMALMAIFQLIVSLPFNLYSTFVIEERHGFNKSTLGLFLKDLLIGFVLNIVITAPLLWVLGAIYEYFGGGTNFFLGAWLGLILPFSLFMMHVYPNYIQPLYNKYEELPQSELRTKIEKLAASINFPLTKLFVVDGSKRSAHSNAYMFGFFKDKRIVLYDTLIKQMKSDDEILAVLAHELGHWYLNHTLCNFFIGQAQIAVMLYLFTHFVDDASMYTSFGYDSSLISSSKYGVYGTIIGLSLFTESVMAPINFILRFLMNLLTRRFEYQADAFATSKLNYGTALKSGLLRISLENLGVLSVDSLYSVYAHSHPHLVERLTTITSLIKQKSD
eukprot:g3267.t1